MRIGPKTAFAKETHARKYRGPGESFEEYAARVASVLKEDDEHFHRLKDILQHQRFLPGGRIQSAVGSPRAVTAYNCYVSDTIEDSMGGIMDAAKNAAQTMRLGGGIGYDFSSIRPRGSNIRSLSSMSSGPISFMQIFDSVCKTVSSAGNRRGAQMAVLRIDHPDIEEFIECKNDSHSLTAFNISVGVTNEFMKAVHDGDAFDLKFDGVVHETVDARRLWEKVMRSTWDWAEPGILFLDTINNQNNLDYCEKIQATNPCGEQPLPPKGACLLGSFNLTKYIEDAFGNKFFNYFRFSEDIADIVVAMDNVIDNTIYPLPEQEEEAKAKRRMGLGITGLANALESLGMEYGSEKFLEEQEAIMEHLANEAYNTSAQIAKKKGVFPLYDECILNATFLNKLQSSTINEIRKHGLRNSHLLSVAPTGTISICADNISSGIEPVFALSYNRTIIKDDVQVVEKVEDYGMKFLGVEGKTSDECTIDEHLAVLLTAQKWVDSAVSKTINVGEHIEWEEFKDIYMKAWKGGAKGITTFRAAGKRYGILNAIKEKPAANEEPQACYYNLETGSKECA